jgi:hypothetical protein
VTIFYQHVHKVIRRLTAACFRQYGYKYADINPLATVNQLEARELEVAIFGLRPQETVPTPGHRCAPRMLLQLIIPLFNFMKKITFYPFLNSCVILQNFCYTE